MTTFAIEIRDEYGAADVPAQRLHDAIDYVLTHHQVEEGAGVTLILTDDEQVQALNAQYRGVDSPTDILSFPAERLPEEIDEELLYLGDLIVAYPYTMQEAQEAGHALGDELVLLAVHGTLHLLGYDHDTAELEESMWAAQSEALSALAVAIDVPRFTFGDETAHNLTFSVGYSLPTGSIDSISVDGSDPTSPDSSDGAGIGSDIR